MRRLMRLSMLAAAVLTAGAVSPAFAQRSEYGVNWACGYEEGPGFVERLKRAQPEDLSCLAGAGLWEETLPRIGGRMDEERQKLRRLLLMILEQNEEALAYFEAEAEAGHDEAVLWLLIARGDRGLESSSVRTRLVSVNLFVSMPPWVREHYASRLADALLAEGDSRTALTLATALETIADNKDEVAQAAMIRARVVERYGTVDEAVAYYDMAADYGRDVLSAEAELRKIALMWRTGYLQTDETVAALKELVTIWRGEQLGAGITMALARAYYFDGQLPQALRLLHGIAGSSAPDSVREEAERRIRAIADDLFIRRTDPATIGDLMDVYEIVRPIVGPSDVFWLGDLSLSAILVRAGLFARAEEVIRGVEPASVQAAGGNEALMTMARLHIIFENRPVARQFLATVIDDGEDTDFYHRHMRLKAEAAEIEDLHPYLEQSLPDDIVRVVAERSWQEGAYGLYTRARMQLPESASWKEPTAEYLATGKYLVREQFVSNPDPRLRALSEKPKPSVYHAEDLRPLLIPSAEVAGLAVSLTRIGQDLIESPFPAVPTVENNETEDETAL